MANGQLKKKVQALIDGMTKEELAASLQEAGLQYYKKMRMPVFNDPQMPEEHAL